MISISVIIPIFNGEKTLNKCLNALSSQTYNKANYEIIVIDDGSTDNTKNIIESYMTINDNIKYFSQTNGGPSKARNYGVSLSKYEYISFIDADAYADINRLQNIALAFEKDNVKVCGGKIDNYNNDYFSNINHIVEFSEFYEDKIKIVKTIPSVNLSVKKEVFEQIGGFDEKLSIGEDSDFNHRLGKRGYKTVYYPSIKIYHDTSNSLKTFIKKQYKFGLKSFEYRSKNPDSNYQFVFNKYLFVFAFPFYVLGNIYLYIKRKYFYKHTIKSLLGLPIIFIYKVIFWLGVGKYLFFIYKRND